MVTDSGAGMDIDSCMEEDTVKSTANNYVEGYEMTQESVTTPESSSLYSQVQIYLLHYWFWRTWSNIYGIHEEEENDE
ncbi:MAG: hypothetical protein R2741_09585 [Methanolobus sp.]